MLTHFPRPVLVIALLAAFAVGIGVGVGAFTGGGGSSADSAGGSEATEAASSPFGPGPTTSTTSTTTTVAPRAATIAFTGDLLPHSPVVAAAAANAEGGGWDFRPMFDEVRPIISAADLAICHLESPLSLDDTGLSGYPVFNAPKALGEAAADAGYDGCSTASNHAYDRGAEGVESTVQALEAVGLPQAGMALTAEADPLPTLYDVNGISVAHISATYGLNGFELPADQPYLVDLIDPASILAEAAAARSGGADFVIVSLHWGEEYRSEPTEDQLAVLGQIAPSSDIDLVVGHHAHVVQPIDKASGKWVVFGLGNFLSNQSASCCVPASQDGMIVTVSVAETSPGVIEATDVVYTPTWVDRGDGYRIRVADPTAATGLPQVTVDALAASRARTVEVVSSRLTAADGLSAGG